MQQLWNIRKNIWQNCSGSEITSQFYNDQPTLLTDIVEVSLFYSIFCAMAPSVLIIPPMCDSEGERPHT